MSEYFAESDHLREIVTAFYVPIGLFGLILACLGLAGVTAQAVERRRKEIGIRMALGARRQQLLRLVMREGVAMICAGAVVGFAFAYGFTRLLSAAYAPMAQILGWGTANRALTAGVPLLLVSLAVAACYLPARRSAGIDPLISLREE